MDSTVHLVQEVDGVRIIGKETHELLQRVPGKSCNVLRHVKLPFCALSLLELTL